tara:strand:- start:1819 stop:2103 length:285 start_codon:yes stop_codon:yes gene_type:complete
MKCENCGQGENTAFCAFCGAELKVVVEDELIEFVTGRLNLLLANNERQGEWDRVHADTMAPSTRAKRGKMALARERKIEKIQSWIEWLSERKEN